MQDSQIPAVIFDPGAGPVCMEVQILPRLIGSYEVLQHDERGSYQGPIMKGTNLGNQPDIFPIPVTLEELDGKFVEWRVIIADVTGETERFYHLRIVFSQQQQNLVGSPIERKGLLCNDTLLIGFTKLEAMSR